SAQSWRSLPVVGVLIWVPVRPRLPLMAAVMVAVVVAPNLNLVSRVFSILSLSARRPMLAVGPAAVWAPVTRPLHSVGIPAKKYWLSPRLGLAKMMYLIFSVR